jgi:hypothetical protein
VTDRPREVRLVPDTVAAITALVLDRPICLGCIALKTGVAVTEVEAIVPKIAAALKLYRDVARCQACAGVARVLSVDRPEGAPPRAAS